MAVPFVDFLNSAETKASAFEKAFDNDKKGLFKTGDDIFFNFVNNVMNCEGMIFTPFVGTRLVNLYINGNDNFTIKIKMSGRWKTKKKIDDTIKKKKIQKFI